MIQLLINILLFLFVYMAVFMVYYGLCVFMSSKSRRFVMKQKFQQSSLPNNIVLVIYARNDEATIVPLLESLNKQNYPKENYQTHIILDNCTDNSSNILEFVGGAKIWRVGEEAPVGKDEAVSWLLERLVSLQNVNAFAFLDAKRKISYDYLSNVNKALFKNDVIVARTDLIDSKNTLSSKIKLAYSNYSNRINMLSRSVMGLSAIINSDACVIKQEVIEKIRCVDFKDVESELKYTTLLIKSGFNCIYNPNLITQLDIKDFKNTKARPLYRFDMVRHCFRLFFKSRPQFAEFVLHSVKPNIWFLIFSYLGLIAFSYNYYFFFDFSVIITFALILMTSFIASLFISKLDKSEIKYLLLFPFYRTCKNFEKSKVYKHFTKIFSPKKTFVNRDVLTVDAIVTDGKNNLHCYLDLVSEDGLARAVLRYKKKKYTSSSQIRMYDAVSDIVEKLDQIGFRIKICHSCGLFTSKIDGSTNMVKGDCLRCKMNPQIKEAVETLIWSTCEDYVPRELGKVIDLNDFRNS